MVNVGPLTSKTYCRVWGTPANFNRFRVLASLLQRRCSTKINQTLHHVWLSPALVHYICALGGGGSCPFKEFCPVQNSLCLAFSYIDSVTARQSSSGHQPDFAAWYKEWNYGTFAEGPPIFGWAAITLGIGPHSSCSIL